MGVKYKVLRTVPGKVAHAPKSSAITTSIPTINYNI